MAKKRKRIAKAAESSEDGNQNIKEVDQTAEHAVDGTQGLVVIGTYEGALLGFSAVDGRQTFGYAPHVGCVKSLNCSQSGRLASGGTDHSVKLFDLSRGVELGDLQEHEGSVVCVDFAGTANLITAGDDGQVCIWRISDWELLLKFRAHKAGISCLAAHPSGRVMASAGRDRSLRLWDLTRGTSAANLTVDEVVEALEWAPGGNHIAALSSHQVLIVTVTSGSSSCWKEPGSDSRLSFCAMSFLREDVVVLGDDRGRLRALESSDAGVKEVCGLPADSQRCGRVKAIVRGTDDAAGRNFVVGMSLGRVEVWCLATGKLPTAAEDAFSRLRIVETDTRLTCVAIWPGRAPADVAEARPMAMKTKKSKKSSAPEESTKARRTKKVNRAKQ